MHEEDRDRELEDPVAGPFSRRHEERGRDRGWVQRVTEGNRHDQAHEVQHAANCYRRAVMIYLYPSSWSALA